MGRVHLWSTEYLTEIARFEGHSDYVKDVVWSADGAALYTPSGDSTIGVWSRTSGLERAEARAERARIVARIEPRLGELLGDARDLAAARARLAARAELTPREREVALQLFLGRGWERRGSLSR
jgi:hypothetical protein